MKAADSVTLIACAPHGATCRRAPGMAAASSSDIALGTSTSSRAATISVGSARSASHGRASKASRAAMRARRLSTPWKPASAMRLLVGSAGRVPGQPVGGIEEDRLGLHVGRRPLVLEQRQAHIEAAPRVAMRRCPAVDDSERAQHDPARRCASASPTRPPSAWPTKWAAAVLLASSTATASSAMAAMLWFAGSSPPVRPVPAWS